MFGGIFMDEILTKIRELITEPMKKMDIFVESVKWEKEYNQNYLKIELDKVNGIDLDTIVAATDVINPILDEANLIKDEYTLEITNVERGEE
jgi:ribosome maturation factor RimP